MYIFNSFYSLHSYNLSFLICLCFNMVSFTGQKKFGPCPDRSPFEGFNSKFPTSIPTSFICGVPPGVKGLPDVLLASKRKLTLSLRHPLHAIVLCHCSSNLQKATLQLTPQPWGEGCGLFCSQNMVTPFEESIPTICHRLQVNV